MSESKRLGPIAVDVMGSDLGPSEMIEGVAMSLKHKRAAGEVIIVGDEAVVNPIIKTKGLDKDKRVSVHHASQVIGMEEKPIVSIREKKDASMMRAIELVKAGKANAIVSCGNTGSLMAGGTLKLRTLPGIERPALASIVPCSKKNGIVIDVGANPTSDPLHLVHNAIMGAHYASILFERENPKVGLLTIGTEEGKGNPLILETHEQLKKINGLINYVGPIEGFSVFEGEIDVIVTDGFVGNILIKTCESLFNDLKGVIRREMTKTWIRKLGSLLCLGALKEVKSSLRPEQHGGAPLLGLNGMVMKSHGSSNSYALMHTIRVAREILQHDMNDHVTEVVAKANDLIAEA